VSDALPRYASECCHFMGPGTLVKQSISWPRQRAVLMGIGRRAEFHFGCDGTRLAECLGLWVLKNSSSENSRKIHRARMPYKRFSRTEWIFSITGFEAICADNEFFNTHACSRQ
jgi:hypothetical protein